MCRDEAVMTNILLLSSSTTAGQKVDLGEQNFVIKRGHFAHRKQDWHNSKIVI